jgi:hypothetical protein
VLAGNQRKRKLDPDDVEVNKYTSCGVCFNVFLPRACCVVRSLFSFCVHCSLFLALSPYPLTPTQHNTTQHNRKLHWPGETDAGNVGARSPRFFIDFSRRCGHSRSARALSLSLSLSVVDAVLASSSQTTNISQPVDREPIRLHGEVLEAARLVVASGQEKKNLALWDFRGILLLFLFLAVSCFGFRCISALSLHCSSLPPQPQEPKCIVLL